MDCVREVSLLLGMESTPVGQCGCCLLAQSAIGRHSNAIAEYVDDDVVVMSGPEVAGLVVLPRRHIGSLEVLPAHDRANVLAALRRAARSVSEGSPGSTARITVLADPSASVDHVCLHVTPSELDEVENETDSPTGAV